MTALCLHDFNADGRLDVVYGGSPQAIVFLAQSASGSFDLAARHTVRDLSTRPGNLALADVIGDPEPELLAIVKGRMCIWPLDGAQLGQPRLLAAGKEIVEFRSADFNGDGRGDIAALLLETPAPLRMWFSSADNGGKALGAEHRFALPPVQAMEPVDLPNHDHAMLALVERASKRIAVHALESEHVRAAGNRDAVMEIHGFRDAGNRKRDHAVIDVNGDGLLDFVVTDTEASTIVVHYQVPGRGMSPGRPAPCFAQVEFLVGANVDGDSSAELFVLSEEESVVGRIDVDDAGPGFPRPVNLRDGAVPVAMNLVRLEDEYRVAVVSKEKRSYSLELVSMSGARDEIALGSLSRAPQTILAHDVDHDGRVDLLLFTRDKPMTLLRAHEDGFVLTESGDLGQFGLVQAASAANVATLDVDADGADELLIADRNFIRAVRVVPDPPPGVSPGWQVVRQINVDDSASKLVSLAVSSRHLIAADEANERLVLIGRDDAEEPWCETESIRVEGFPLGAIHAGAFAGDGEESILAVNDDGFAVIRLGGSKLSLREVGSWRSDDEQRFYHRIITGDVNGDGLMDMIALDAREQICEVFTFSRAGRLVHALGFPVFESRLFTAGDGRQYEPSAALIADITGDGANDLVMLAHDRVLMYPQMTSPSKVRE